MLTATDRWVGNEAMKARVLPREPTASWFRRIVVLKYYDGTLNGIAECPEGHVAVLRMVDWDELQDMRIFAVVEEQAERFDELAQLVMDTDVPRWPVHVPREPFSLEAQRHIDRVLAAADREPDYVVASEEPAETVVTSATWPKGVDLQEARDWFVELGIERAREGDDDGPDSRS